MPETRTVSLPAELCERAEKKFGATFGSLEQMLKFVLSELLRDDASEADLMEKRLVEERLRELGYL